MSNRKTKLVTIETPGRDQGKSFLVTEMSALRGERWATRAFHEIMKAGGNADGYTAGAGWEALAIAGYKAFGKLDVNVIEPLWDELLTCITRVEDHSRPEVQRPLVESDMAEIATIVLLKFEAFSIHANFSQAVAAPISTMAQTTMPVQPSPNTSTSQPRSGPSYHPARRRSPNLAPR
jgi:hypothetical protein